MNSARFAFSLFRNSSQRKHVFSWCRSLQKYYLLDKKQPWLVFDAIDYLNSLPLGGKKIMEYGSGGSTLFWLNHGAECTSIEHDPYWYKIMSLRLKWMLGIDYRLVLPELAEDKEGSDFADPNLYLSGDVAFRGYNFRNYVRQIDPFPDNFFDIILIDGRARPSCIMRSVSKIKIGGLIILDDSDRHYYLSKTITFLNNFTEKKCVGAVPKNKFLSATSIFTKLRNS